MKHLKTILLSMPDHDGLLSDECAKDCSIGHRRR